MKKIISSFATIALLSAGVAQANTNIARSGMTFSANVGYSIPTGDFKANQSDVPDGSVSNNNVSFGGAIGYDYAISEMFTVGAEVGIQYMPDFAKESEDGGSITQSNLSVPILAVGKFYVPNVDGLNLFAKAGIAYNHWKASGSGSIEVVDPDPATIAIPSASDNNWNAVVAAGVGYDINNFNIFAQYTYNWLRVSAFDETAKGGINTIAIGVGYKLPM